MSFFDKIYDIAHADLFKYVFHSGRDNEFVANVSKITTVNENVLDSKSHIQQIRVCEASVTNAKSVNDHYVTTTEGCMAYKCSNSWLDTPQFISSTVIPDLLPIFCHC